MSARTFRSMRFGPPGAAQQSLGIPTAAYPGRVATNADLMVAVDRQQATLLLPMNITDTQMTVIDPSMIGAFNLLSIDNEIVKTTGPPAGNVIPVSRGFDGTTPVGHLANAVVTGLIDAYHHNALVAEIKAIEATLGPNLSNIPSTPPPAGGVTSVTGGPGITVSPTTGAVVVNNQWGAVTAGQQTQFLRIKPNTGNNTTLEFSSPLSLNSADYNFPPQTPGGSLGAGGNSITLAPVPVGVNGSDQNHVVLITGGSGATEAALITGGTAVSGAASGTLFITCANAHSGAWTVQSATAGLQEAINSLPGIGGTINIPSGGWNIYGPITINTLNRTFIQGAGVGSTILNAQMTSGDLFRYIGVENVNGYNHRLSNLSMSAPGGANTLKFIHLSGTWWFFLDHCFMGGMQIGVLIDQNGANISGAIFLRENHIASIAPGGSGILATGVQDLFIDHNIIEGGASAIAGVELRHVFAGCKLTCNDVFATGSHGLLIDPQSGQSVVGVESTNNWYDSCGTCVDISPATGGQVNHVKMLEDWACTSTVGPGIHISGAGVVDDVDISQTIAAGNANSGVLVDASAATYLRFHNLTVSGNSTSSSGGAAGFAIVSPVTHVQISGGRFGPIPSNPANSQSFGIYLEVVASDFMDIHDADVSGNLTGGLAKGTTGANNNIRNVRGYNPLGQQGITVGASPFSYKAGSSPEVVYLFGGTITNITLAGTAISAATTGTPMQVTLSPNVTMVVTYSVIPNMIKSVQ